MKPQEVVERNRRCLLVPRQESVKPTAAGSTVGLCRLLRLRMSRVESILSPTNLPLTNLTAGSRTSHRPCIRIHKHGTRTQRIREPGSMYRVGKRLCRSTCVTHHRRRHTRQSHFSLKVGEEACIHPYSLRSEERGRGGTVEASQSPAHAQVQP